MQYWENICLHVYSPICCQNAVICGNLLTVFFLQSAKVGFVNSRILYIYSSVMLRAHKYTASNVYLCSAKHACRNQEALSGFVPNTFEARTIYIRSMNGIRSALSTVISFYFPTCSRFFRDVRISLSACMSVG